MNEFDKVWQDLEEFLKGKENSSPCETIELIRIWIDKALKLTKTSEPFSFIFLQYSEVFGIQQFVTKFGCRLVYQFSSTPEDTGAYYSIRKYI